MSSIGKIFIILNLLLAGAFLGWSSQLVAKGEDVQGQLNEATKGHETDKAKWDEERGALTSQLNAAKEAQRTAREEKDRAVDKANSLESQLQEARNQNAQLRGEVTKLTDQQSGFNETIRSLEQGKSDATERAFTAEQERDAAERSRGDAERAMRDAEDAAQLATSQVADLEKALTSAKKEIAKLETMLSVAVEYVPAAKLAMAQPAIDALVVSVREDVPPGLVTLNVGADQGVERGMTFQIYGKDWKGEVKVESVRPDMCSAIVLNRAEGQTLAQGDKASTVL
jgi:FtsZ-binding cell division protein ZapB